MKKSIFSLLLLFIACNGGSEENEEHSSSTYNALLLNTCAASSVFWKNDLYLFGGSDDYNGTTNYSTILKYDGAQWITFDSIPDTKTWDGKVVLSDDDAYYVNGWPSDSVLLRRYNFSSKTWKILPKGSLTDDWGTAVELVGNVIYNISPDGYVEAYSIAANTWEMKQNTSLNNKADQGIASAVYGTDIYITGFGDSTFYKYSTSSNQMTELAKLPVLMSAPTLEEYHGIIYCIGGAKDIQASKLYSTVYAYNISKGTWSLTSHSINKARFFLTSSILNDQIVVIAGIDSLENGTLDVDLIDLE